MHKVFVYGTLRTGQGNWRHILYNNSNLLGQTKTEADFTMLHLGGFPGIINKGDTRIIGEVFEVDDVVFKRLDMLEGYPTFYNRKKISTEFGEAWIYYLDSEGYMRDGIHVIKSGDWLHQEV